jgi:hypothetical protein
MGMQNCPYILANGQHFHDIFLSWDMDDILIEGAYLLECV